MGLRERLKIMTDTDEILGTIFVALEEYKYASDKTKLAWKRTATKRLKELENQSNSTNNTKKQLISNKSGRSRKK